MKKNILLLLSLFLVMNCFAQETKEVEEEIEIEEVEEIEIKTSVYYFIRHAEKDRSDKKNKDPKLTKAGSNRAVYWTDVFKNVAFDAVYATDYNRTKETAVPTAEANKVELTLYHPFKIDFKQFLKDTEGKTTLIVGHSNTTPDFVNRLLNEEKFEHIDDSNNGNLYIVTITGDSKTVQLLTLN